MQFRNDPNQMYYDHDPYAQAVPPRWRSIRHDSDQPHTVTLAILKQRTRTMNTSTGSWCRLPHT
ncbi:hypothetical protein C8Q74DRAFT_1296432 [Fomes fomentarius]|nr:hypothetical protein C8Q74DRAFT_1296432 [Fomes fomentarius]